MRYVETQRTKEKLNILESINVPIFHAFTIFKKQNLMFLVLIMFSLFMSLRKEEL